MEERLDDAIHVLRTHAEGSLPPGLASSLLSAGAAAAAAAAAGGAGVQGVSYSTSVGSSVPSVVQPMEQMVSQSFNPSHILKWPKSKLRKILKSHFVQFWETNGAMWEYFWRGFIQMVTPYDFVHSLKS